MIKVLYKIAPDKWEYENFALGSNSKKFVKRLQESGWKEDEIQVIGEEDTYEE